MAQSSHDLPEQDQKILLAPLEVTDGDLVRCPIAPYLFRARITGGSLLLEPIGAEGQKLDLQSMVGIEAGRPGNKTHRI